MDEIGGWIISICIAGAIWFGIQRCEDKPTEEEEEPVYTQWQPTPQNSYTSSQSTSYTTPSTSSYNDDWEPEIVEEELIEEIPLFDEEEEVKTKPVDNQHTYPQREQVLQIISSLTNFKNSFGVGTIN